MEFTFLPNNPHHTISLHNTSLKCLQNDSSKLSDHSQKLLQTCQTQIISSFSAIILEVWTPWKLSHLMNHFNQLMAFITMGLTLSGNRNQQLNHQHAIKKAETKPGWGWRWFRWCSTTLLSWPITKYNTLHKGKNQRYYRQNSRG